MPRSRRRRRLEAGGASPRGWSQGLPTIVKICGLSSPETLLARRSPPARTWRASSSSRRARAISTSRPPARSGCWRRTVSRKVALTVDADDAALDDDRRGARARHAAAPWEGDARAGRGGQGALRPAGHQGDRRRERRGCERGAAPMRASPMSCCSTPSPRRTPPFPAGPASPSTGICCATSARPTGCFPAVSTPEMSPER